MGPMNSAPNLLKNHHSHRNTLQKKKNADADVGKAVSKRVLNLSSHKLVC